MATAKMLEFIIGLILVIIVFAAIGGCVSSYLNPKCDLDAISAFDDFVKIYGGCLENNKDECKCGSYDISELSKSHSFVLTPLNDKVAVDLKCYGRVVKSKRKFFNGDVCFYNPSLNKIYSFGEQGYDKFDVVSFYDYDVVKSKYPSIVDEGKIYLMKKGNGVCMPVFSGDPRFLRQSIEQYNNKIVEC